MHRQLQGEKGEEIEIRERKNVGDRADGLERDIERFGYYKEHGLPPDIAVMLMRLMDASKNLIQALRNDAVGLERLSSEDLLVVADKLDLIREALEAISMEVWSIEREISSLSQRRESELFERTGITQRSTAAIHLDSVQLRALDIELDSIRDEVSRRKESLRLERAGKDLTLGIGKKKPSDSDEC